MFSESRLSSMDQIRLIKLLKQTRNLRYRARNFNAIQILNQFISLCLCFQEGTVQDFPPRVIMNYQFLR